MLVHLSLCVSVSLSGLLSSSVPLTHTPACLSLVSAAQLSSVDGCPLPPPPPLPHLLVLTLSLAVGLDGDACVSVGGAGRLDCHWLSPCDMAVATAAVLLVHLSLCVSVSQSGSIPSSVPLTHTFMSVISCLSCTTQNKNSKHIPKTIVQPPQKQGEE